MTDKIMRQIAVRYEKAMGSPPPREAADEMMRHVERRGAHFVAYCLAEARRRNARSWSYVRSILRNQDDELIEPEREMPHSIRAMLDDDTYTRTTADEFLDCLDTYAACIGERLSDGDLEFLMEVYNERGDHYLSYLIFESARRGQRRIAYIRELHEAMPGVVVDSEMVEDAFDRPSLAERSDPGASLADVLPFEVVVTPEEPMTRESES